MAKRKSKPEICPQCGEPKPGHIKGCRLHPDNLPKVKGIRVIMRGGIPKVDWVIIRNRTKTKVTYQFHHRTYTDPLDTVLIPRHPFEENDCRTIEQTARRLFNDASALKATIAQLKRAIYGESTTGRVE